MITDRSLTNKQVEIVGEAGARRWVQQEYAADYLITPLAVPRRGKFGPQVLDQVYELRHRRTGAKRFLVVEAKGGSSRLAKSQFSGAWFVRRFAELESKGDLGVEMAARLRQAAVEGRIEAVVLSAETLPGMKAGGLLPWVDAEHVVLRQDRSAELLSQFRGPKSASAGAEAAGLAGLVRAEPAVEAFQAADAGRHWSRFRLALATGIRELAGVAVDAAIGSVLIPYRNRRYEKEAVARWMRTLRPKIEAEMISLLRQPGVVQRFERAPYDQFWFEIKSQQHWAGPSREEIDRGNYASVRLDRITLDFVRVVDVSGDSVCALTGAIGVKECVSYEPIFPELSQGQLLAVRGIRLPKTPRSHDVTQTQWLWIVRDYLLFARKHAALQHLSADVWSRFRLDFCASPTHQDLFTPGELENCKDELLLLRMREERGLTPLPLRRERYRPQNP